MKEYTIFQAAKQINVDPYLIRQWEEELDLTVRKNVLRQRYYLESDIERLRKIKELKAQGLQGVKIKSQLK